MRKKIVGSCERRKRGRKWFETNRPTKSKVRLKPKTRETLKIGWKKNAIIGRRGILMMQNHPQPEVTFTTDAIFYLILISIRHFFTIHFHIFM